MVGLTVSEGMGFFKMNKIIFSLVAFFLLLSVVEVRADGNMDITGTGTNRLNTALQTLSPRPGTAKTQALTSDTTYNVDVSKLKFIKIEGITGAGANTPIQVWFTTASNTDISAPFTVNAPTDFGIGAGVLKVYFKNYTTGVSGASVNIIAR